MLSRLIFLMSLIGTCSLNLQAASTPGGEETPSATFTVDDVQGLLREDRRTIQRELRARPYLVTNVERDGWTLLHYAAWHGLTDAILALLDQGANLEAQTNQGNTPFLLALFNKNDDAADLLLKHGATVDVKAGYNPFAKNSWQPLHYAAEAGMRKTIIALLARGARIDAQTDDGYTPAILASLHGHPVADLLGQL